MVSSNTIKDFHNHNTMYPSGRKTHCSHRIYFVDRYSNYYEDDYYGETGPIVPRYTTYVHSGICHPINKGNDWSSCRYPKVLFHRTKYIPPIASKSIVLRKSEDVTIYHTITTRRDGY